MMLAPIAFSYTECLKEGQELQAFLGSRTTLKERDEILPFFKKRQHLSAFLCVNNARAVSYNRIAYEYPLFGDFTCDLVVGDWEKCAYVFVEFEQCSIPPHRQRRARGGQQDDHGDHHTAALGAAAGDFQARTQRFHRSADDLASHLCGRTHHVRVDQIACDLGDAVERIHRGDARGLGGLARLLDGLLALLLRYRVDIHWKVGIGHARHLLKMNSRDVNTAQNRSSSASRRSSFPMSASIRTKVSCSLAVGSRHSAAMYSRRIAS